MPKLWSPPEIVASFERWGLPAPELFVPALGVAEAVAGVLLVVGLATRSAAILLAAIMVGALLTAGVADGGVHIVAPGVLAVPCAILARFGGGAWQLGRRRKRLAARP